jgi:hypothetical protein
MVRFNRIPMVAVCRKNRHDIFNPFTIVGMFQSVNMGKDMRIMPVGFLCTGTVGMLHLMVLRFKRVRQVSYLLSPYGFENRIMGLELVESDNLAPELTGLVVIDQHPVAEKFLADSGAVRVDYAPKPRAFSVPAREYAPFLRGVLTVVLHFLEFIGKFISKIWQHVNPEEFIGDSVPAIIIMVGNLSFNFYEIPKTFAALPATVALKLHHSKIHFMLINIIKIGI